MLVFLLVGSITAIGITLNNRDLSLTREQKTSLESINLADYSTTDYLLNGNYSRCLNKEVCQVEQVEFCDGNWDDKINDTIYECYDIPVTKCRNVINTCSGYMEESKLDSWEEEKLKRIADVTITRNNPPEIVREGITTIK